MNYKITFTGASKSDTYTSYTNTMAQALMQSAIRSCFSGYKAKIKKVA